MSVLVLDYDGTLHESMAIYEPAVRHALHWLIGCGYVQSDDLTTADIAGWLGYTGKDMWDSVLPHADQEVKNQASALVGEHMMQGIREGKARLYPSTLQVLDRLKGQGHSLLFLSNCTHRYMVAHRDHFDLQYYFDDFYCAEDYDYAPKPRIFETIRTEYPTTPPDDYVIVGDRSKDVEVALHHGLRSVGCVYGYGGVGELSQATTLCNDICELPELVARL